MEVTKEDFVHQLDWLVDGHQVVDLETAIARWDDQGSDRLVVLTFDDGYRDTFTTAFPLMADRGLPFTLYVASQQVENASNDSVAEDAPLTWDQVNRMLESGLMTLGAHTHTHRDLRSASHEEVEEELGRSDELIATRTGVAPRHFAYPWGYWSETADPAVREHYESAVLGGSPATRRALSEYQIPRFPVQRSDGWEFFPARLRGGLLLEERVRRWLRGYRGP
ncbi:MAG: polysaccharide deacetylase family protein [Acidimicrobiia bacterium]